MYDNPQKNDVTMPPNFHIGDVVTLKSDPKKMTVVSCDENTTDRNGYNLLICQWLDRDNRLQTAAFTSWALKHALDLVETGELKNGLKDLGFDGF
ncbi:DUF2158 domain-containing protein [Xenorhabdus bharatensis]|uniref:DUF2158 domain-containing protein n=1 Tax=Xenorhabdus bharatensis TaxID=3136256 RepID=UPI0030F3CAC9